MEIALVTGHRHPYRLLAGLSEGEWLDILAFWTAEPRGELRADYRAALQTNQLMMPHLKMSHRKLNLDCYRINFDDPEKMEEFERVSAEFLEATAGMDYWEVIEYTKANYAPAGASD